MKKLLLCLLLIPSLGQAQYQSIFGSTVTVTAPAGGAVKVDGSGFTQPVSGTFFQTTQPISGNVKLTQDTVLGATVTFNGVTQPVTVLSTPTVYVVNPATVTFNGVAQPVSQSGNWSVFGSTVGIVYGGTAGTNLPVQVNVSTIAVVNQAGANLNVYLVNPATVTFNGATQPVTVLSTPTVYVVNPTSAPIQIQTSGGSLNSVGFQTAGSSLPVQVQNIVYVQGSIADKGYRNALPTQDMELRNVQENDYLQNYANGLSAIEMRYGFEIR